MKPAFVAAVVTKVWIVSPPPSEAITTGALHDRPFDETLAETFRTFVIQAAKNFELCALNETKLMTFEPKVAGELQVCP